MRNVLRLCAALLWICAVSPCMGLANEAGVSSDSAPQQRVRVLILVRDDCPKCEEQLQQLQRPGGPFEALKARGWKIGESAESHIQITKPTTVPELAKSLGDIDYPAIMATDEKEVVRYFKSGCTTPLDQWTIGWLISGKNERPTEPVSEPARVASTGNYRLRGNHWSVEGNFNPSQEYVVAHLRGPNHSASAAAYPQIETWSVEELRSLHDDLHEREGGLSSGVGAARSSGSRSSSSRPSYLTPKGLR
jgi:hypothetical protein